MINNKVDNFFSISLILILPSLITGPFIPDFILTFSSIFFLFFLFAKKEQNFLNRYFFIYSAFFIILLIFSSIKAGYAKSIISSFGYFRFLIFIFLTIYILKYSKKDIYLLLFYSLLCGLIYLFCEFIFQSIFQKTILGASVYNTNRLIISSFYHEEIISSYVVRIFPFFLGLFFLVKERLNIFFKTISFFLFFFIFLLSIYNGERVALALLFLSLIILFTFLELKKSFKILIFLFSTLLFSIVLIFLPQENIERKLSGVNDLYKTLIQLKSDKNDQSLILYSEKYDSMFKTSINIYKKNKVFGVGMKNFRNYCHKSDYAYNSRSCSTHPHNLFIQILAETGLIGILTYMLAFVISIRLLFLNKFKNKENANKKNYLTCLYTSIIISLWPLFPSGNFFNNWISIIYFFPVGFVIKELYFNDNK